MTRHTTSRNKTHYTWYVHGTICGQEVAQKYSSLGEFLDDFGGEKTILNLNKSKVARLKRKWIGNTKQPQFIGGNHTEATDQHFAKHWNVRFVPIREIRVEVV